MKFLLLLILSAIILHPVHLSVTNVEYRPKKRNMVISVRLFADDFERIIDRRYNISSNLNKEDELNNIEKYITDYVYENLQFKINGVQINKKNLKLKSRKTKDISIWLTYNLKNNLIIKECEIINTLMFDLYPDQKNILIFSSSDKQQALEFFKNKPITVINP